MSRCAASCAENACKIADDPRRRRFRELRVVAVATREIPRNRQLRRRLLQLLHQHQAPTPAETEFAAQLAAQSEDERAIRDRIGNQARRRRDALGEQRDVDPAVARLLVVPDRDRRVVATGPRAQRVVVAAGKLRDARERNPLGVEDPLRGFAPRTGNARAEHEPQAGQIARGRDVDPVVAAHAQ